MPPAKYRPFITYSSTHTSRKWSNEIGRNLVAFSRFELISKN